MRVYTYGALDAICPGKPIGAGQIAYLDPKLHQVGLAHCPNSRQRIPPVIFPSLVSKGFHKNTVITKSSKC